MSDTKGTILLTGANGGLGSAIVSHIVSSPEFAAYHGIYTARNATSAPSLDAALSPGTQSPPPPPPHSFDKVSLDLSRLSDVRKVAADINSRVAARTIPPIRAIVLNAGIEEFATQTWTEDGLDMTFATNYLGHWLLTLLLLKSMDRERGRIIWITSWSHYPQDRHNAYNAAYVGKYHNRDIISDDLEPIARGTWSPSKDDSTRWAAGYRRYGASKFHELQRRLDRDPLLGQMSVLALDPGAMPTGIVRLSDSWFLRVVMFGIMLPAMAAIWAWFSPNGSFRTMGKSARDVVAAAFACGPPPLCEQPKGVFLDGSEPGGTAGCVLASRLSEDPNVTVLVLEKGGVKDNMVSRMPLLSQNLFMGDTLQVQSARWSEPIPEANGRKTRPWTAEGMGGATRINAMLLTRGCRGDYAAWSDELGLGDWDWEHVEPYLRAIENAVAHPDSKARGHEGTGAIATRLEMDTESGIVSGVRIRSSQKLANTQASSTKDFLVKARREVIICSGAICTPQLLLLSGIGPKIQNPQKQDDDLKNIAVFKELPAVGARQADHYSFPIMLELPKKETFHVLESLWGLWYILLWVIFGTRLMGVTSTPSAIYVRTNAIDTETMTVQAHEEDGTDNLDASQPRNVPDTEIMVIPVNGLERHPRATGRVELASTDPLANPRITHPLLGDERDLAAARVAVRFTMRLAEEFQNSGYPYPAPFAFAPGNKPGLLREWEKSGGEGEGEEEEEVIGTAANPVPDIAPPPPALPNAGAGVHEDAGEEVARSSDHEEGNSKTWKNVTDGEIDDYIRRVSHTSLHFSCTCPMSNNDEKSGVVDQRLRVYGFKHLRFADASMFPRVPSGHTMAPVMMVAERCAHFVKEEWKDRCPE
ncbi:hypothetical protein VMCG_07516 [Cytospora schulzeri]|uniref:Glucose-methanol-choline oxidoreductase N-terminal domain-containing protein n=1 Tax=Cytospora schulzeri TaxID=448051 RepID=A0A423W189_9PEZI|nr:hypothetical protein VMCG_07516 [Valsa malicola]